MRASNRLFVRFWGLALWLAGLTSTGWAQTVTERSLGELPESKLYEAALAAMQTDNLAQAIELMALLIRTSPQHAGAWLDLAELYCRSGRETEARTTLMRLKRELPSIAGKVDALTPLVLKACAPAPPPPVAFNSFIEAGGGTNSNVNLGSIQRELIVGPVASPLLLTLSGDSVPRADSFTDYKGSTSVTFGNSDRLAVTIAARDYANQTQFNELITSLDWQHQLTTGPWQTVVSAGPKWTLIDNKIYAQSLQLGAELYTPVSVLGGRVSFGVSLSPTRYAEASAFNVLSTMARVGMQWTSGAQIEAVWQKNTATNTRPGGDAEGYQLKGRYEWALVPGWRAGLHGQVQSMQDKSIFFPGLFDLFRKQESWSLVARVEHDLAPGWITGLDFSNFSQTDNIPILSFEGREMKLWVRKQF
jgi:tetratricopeptide (TPR) repeat protein